MSKARRHPAALPFLSLTEMWERFGFYVVQGILMLYLTKALGFSDSEGYSLTGAFSALAYIAPLLGGIIADRLLGFKSAVMWGGIFLILGYALLALPGMYFFYLGLATIIVGTGLFKSNISTLLGALYPPGDTAREAGFTLFYIGINIGVLLSGTSDLIREHFGWHNVFAFASAGLMFGLAIFCWGMLQGKMTYNHAVPLLRRRFYFSKIFLGMYCVAAIAMLSYLLQTGVLGKWLLPLFGIGLLFFIFIFAYRQNVEDRNKLLSLNILIISSVIFWSIFLQMFFSVTLFIDRLVDKQLFGLSIPTTEFYPLESIFVILLGPLFAWSWQTLNQANKNPSTFLKFVLAIAMLSIGFLLLAVSASFPNANNMVSPWWIVLAYLLFTIGEMLLYPIGLSAVTLLSPPKFTGMMMGIWFVALGYGGQFAGMLAKIASVPESTQHISNELLIYQHAFLIYAILAFVVAMILFFVQMLVKKNLQES